MGSGNQNTRSESTGGFGGAEIQFSFEPLAYSKKFLPPTTNHSSLERLIGPDHVGSCLLFIPLMPAMLLVQPNTICHSVLSPWDAAWEETCHWSSLTGDIWDARMAITAFSLSRQQTPHTNSEQQTAWGSTSACKFFFCFHGQAADKQRMTGKCDVLCRGHHCHTPPVQIHRRAMDWIHEIFLLC